MNQPAPFRTRVKICGITRLEDAINAIEAGADALGFVFYAPSPRAIEISKARDIITRLPAFVTTVGLFVNAERDTIAEAVAVAGIDLLQFHGNECPEYCAAHGRRWIKAVRMRDDIDLHKIAADYSASAGLLLDAYRPGVPGGTGETFDWQRIPEDLAAKIILAGGLDADNISTAIHQLHPYAVDVSGGVEASKGIKDAQKIKRFIRGVTLGNE